WNNEAFQKEESALNKLTNSISQYFVLIILGITLASAVFWYFKDPSEILQVVTAILIITCPCALGLSSPFILGNVMRIFGEKKFFIRSTATIEAMAKVDEIVFDKTGTITESQSSKVNYVGIQLTDWEKRAVKSVMKNSNHPLSRILYDEIKSDSDLVVEKYEEIIGKGQIGEVEGKRIQLGSSKFVGLEDESMVNQTQVYIAINGEVKGKF